MENHRRRMKAIWVMGIILLIVGFHSYGYAASAGDETLGAVVRIRSVFPAGKSSATPQEKERIGNGVVIDAEGTILTLSFLTRDADTIEVTVRGKEAVEAKLIGFDYDSGLSLLRTVKPLQVTPIKLGSSSTLKVGDTTIAAGADGNREVQVTQVISRKEFAGSWEYFLEDAIFTAPIFEDFSGAALINGKGQLVGIGYLYTQLSSQGYEALLCNMFIPIDALQPVLEDLKSAGRPLKAARPWLGINVEAAHGRVFINRVRAGGPAEKAGLKADDMIIAVNGKEVNGLADFYRKVWDRGNAGAHIVLTVLKGAKIEEIKVISSDRYKEGNAASRKAAGI